MKQYDIKSRRRSVTLLINTGKQNVYCTFEKSFMGDGVVSYSTDNPELQQAIENSAEFKAGIIVINYSNEPDADKPLDHVPLKEENPSEQQGEAQNPEEKIPNEQKDIQVEVETAEEEASNAQQDKPEATECAAQEVYSNVETLQQAKEVLAKELGIAKNHPSLRPNNLVATAAKNNIKFPNLKL